MKKVQARSYWVWTELAEQNWDNRYKGKQREAGQPIENEAGDSREVDPAWLLRGYVIDATDYIPANGQMDLFEFII
ncbi:hypothetical protein M5W83_11625 [Paenibacillus thiaminolyticus]|uniref:Uncharacterized protein n=1 Tax=Paenibacillus thiaminolyticus TaxID=49283 RepID=A0AAP9J169_PANTH|nr:hypothetical protein [Paenibacillus thiaminolyticus]MCY9533742.1 hypothetical protein [Paenibacillus thiaminolyticus]MCY9600233.1 hypothetical protein [Paenibacillus thiaminolyticus]MCY9607793.1 hypothetical protein [Paenibacillus thiaminolyticus]MCY9611954.1 hypothetical protein [Paenibacillus thiaminolyticus]MCY9617826.1 hypothetical protein [Paenibacillus thiaminolyticus]